MSTEDPFFLLYTSGPTGKTKGLMHTTAGFLPGANITTAYVFDMQKADVHFCAGDIACRLILYTGHCLLEILPLSLREPLLIRHFSGTGISSTSIV